MQSNVLGGWWLGVVLGGLGLMVGCSQATRPVAPTVSLQVGDEKTFEEMLGKHHGQVVLVDFWATWCAPCMQQFPHTVALSQRHRPNGLAVISVSMDEPDAREAVLGFLAKQQASFDNLLTNYGAGGAFVDAFQLRGDVPFYRLYDRQGKLRYSFSSDPSGIENCETIDQLDIRVAELLAPKPE